MYDAITDFFVSWMGLQSFVYIFFLGYLTLLIYFYGSEKWEKFSDFDKIGFSFLIGLAIWILLIRPLSSYLLFVRNTFFSFTSESYIFAPSLTQQWSSFFILSLAIIGFIGWLRLTNGNKPLYEINEAFKLTIKGLFVLWFGVILSLLFFVIALHLADYEIYSSHLFKTLLPHNIFFLSLFIFIILVLNGKLYEYREKLSFGQIKHNKKLRKYIIMAVFVIIIVSPVFGLFLFKPTIQDYGETIHSITNDSRLTIGYKINYGAFSVPEELICREYITKEYTINTKMLSWVRVDEPDFIVTDAKRWINKSTSKNYATYETYFIVNESRYQEVNVTVNGYRNITLIKDEDYIFEVESRIQGNITEINFTIINKMPRTLYLSDIRLYTPEYNLTSYTKTVGIDRVEGVDPKHIRIEADLASEQSGKVILVLEKIEMNTTAKNNQNNH